MPSAAELAWLIPVLPLMGAAISGLGLLTPRGQGGERRLIGAQPMVAGLQHQPLRRGPQAVMGGNAHAAAG